MAGRILLLDAFCWQTGRTRQLKMTAELALHVQKSGPRWRYYELRGDHSSTVAGSSVHEVLTEPVVVFGGLRDLQEGGVCYCGKPQQRWTEGGVRCPPPPNRVFLVFVNPRDEVFDWAWAEEDPEMPGYPVGHESRFKGGVLSLRA